jgi:CheY-like chemotaxis protein
MRVLIADDDKSLAGMLAALVRHCDHEVVEVVGSGLRAVQSFHRLRPDVALLDVTMPQLNGITACRQIVSQFPQAKVVLFTSFLSEEELKLKESGAIAVLLKPLSLFSVKHLLDRLEFEQRQKAA